jgi:serine/threonine-protein kinase
LDAGLAAGFGRPADGPGSVLSELCARLGDLRPVLLKEAEGESAHIVQPKSDAMPPPEEAGDRYQLQGEIARGGMGAVLRGRDVDLGRDLAVKVLLEKYVDRPEVARRFIEEAQIGGQLQHPGVVPVYDIGHFGQRPFFTMKLVKGHTLAALLGERADPAADRPRFLGIALQVAQTLAYAHAKGVIHRDLKPANVMVGAFGEVQVMDWGLAKVLAEGGVADEERAGRAQHAPGDVTTIRTARSSGSRVGTDTEAGSLLGTPAYMPPEQANGDVANLDRRADVFGLGSILCEVLTGQPPYVGRSSEEVRRKAANGDLANATARLDDCGADTELIALTKACLSPEAVDRPRDAKAVAEGLTAYLDGVQERLHQAELAEAEAKAKAMEEAKRRRLTLALAATVLLALTLGGGGWLWVRHERDARIAQVTRDVNEALNQALALREQAKAAPAGGAASFGQAREQAQRALALVENDPTDARLADQVRQLQAELDEEEKDRTLVAALDAARLEQTELAAGGKRFAHERAVPKFREAFAAYGLAVGEGEPAAAAQRIRQRPAAVREAIVAALDEWDILAGMPAFGIREPHREWLRAVLAAAEPDDAWSRQVRATRSEPDHAKRRAALEELAAAADVERRPARSLTILALQLDPTPRAALLRRAQAHYPADFWVNLDLCAALEQLSPPDWDGAVRFLTAALALRPDNAAVLSNLGTALQSRGQVDEAIACHRRAIELDPNVAPLHSNLGNALREKGQLEEAIACCRQAIALDPTLPHAHLNLGNALEAEGLIDEAIASYRRAIELDPTRAQAHINLGHDLKNRGQVDEAIACYHKALALDPKSATAHTGLGDALHRTGQVDEAITSYRKAIELNPNLSLAHCNLGRVLADKGQVDEAITSYHKAIEVDPKNAVAHYNLGNALDRKGQVDGAIASYRKAIEVDPKFAPPHNNLGAALDGQGQVDEAIVCYRKALELDPKYADAHGNLGIALKDKGKVDEAIACLRKALELDPKLALVHLNLGVALAGKGAADEAIACLRQAVELDPRNAAAHNTLGKALHEKGQVEEAIACCRKAIELDPKNASAHINLGASLAVKGQADAAIACFRKAIELDPKKAIFYYNLGNVLRGQGRLDEAITCYHKAIELDPKYVSSHGVLGRALLDKGQYREARDATSRALELLPDKDPLRPVVSRQLQKCERFVNLAERLDRLLTSEDKPASVQEFLDVVVICRHKRLHAAAVRFSAAAFTADPKLADDLRADHRYNAACDAALAAADRGAEAAKLDDKEKARLRKQALDWLRADLALRSKQLESGQPAEHTAAQQALRHWQQDSDLAGLRDAAALAKLSAEERAPCKRLWSEVAALLKKAETPAK